MAPSFVESIWPEAHGLARQLKLVGGDIREVILCGSGDSHHAAHSLSYAFRWWTDRPARGVHAMEAGRYIVPQLGRAAEHVLLVGISASGETARTLEAVELGSKSGAQTLAVTGQRKSSLAQAADYSLVYSLPKFDEGPGLLSYLASLLMGYGLAAALSNTERQQTVEAAIAQLPQLLGRNSDSDRELGVRAAGRVDPSLPIVFVGAGPAYGSAMFAAAKVIEAAGKPAWAQDTEEWAHIEYFIEPAASPVWLLNSDGRASSRERELVAAAKSVGRDLTLSSWRGEASWEASLTELLAPTGLWIGPVAYADELMARLDERPFRGFASGRSRAEGGGASRIRSSARAETLGDLRGKTTRN